MKQLSTVPDFHGESQDIVYCDSCLEHCLVIQPLHPGESVKECDKDLKCEYYGRCESR